MVNTANAIVGSPALIGDVRFLMSGYAGMPMPGHGFIYSNVEQDVRTSAPNPTHTFVTVGSEASGRFDVRDCFPRGSSIAKGLLMPRHLVVENPKLARLEREQLPGSERAATRLLHWDEALKHFEPDMMYLKGAVTATLALKDAFDAYLKKGHKINARGESEIEKKTHGFEASIAVAVYCSSDMDAVYTLDRAADKAPTALSKAMLLEAARAKLYGTYEKLVQGESIAYVRKNMDAMSIKTARAWLASVDEIDENATIWGTGERGERMGYELPGSVDAQIIALSRGLWFAYSVRGERFDARLTSALYFALSDAWQGFAGLSNEKIGRLDEKLTFTALLELLKSPKHELDKGEILLARAVKGSDLLLGFKGREGAELKRAGARIKSGLEKLIPE